MAIQNFDRKELEKKLEDIINLLIKKGLFPEITPNEKKELVKTVSETLINDPKINLTKEDLNKEDVQKSLGLSCMAQLLAFKDPNHQFDYSILFKKQLDIEPKALQNELKKLFTNILKLNPIYQQKPQNEKNLIEADINQLVLNISKLLKDNNEPLAKNEKVMGFVTAGLDMLSEQRRSLYGVDTHTPGSTFAPVLSVPFGEQMGLQDLAHSGESFMAKRDEPTGAPDPLGIHMASLLNFLMDGNTTAYENYLMKNDVIPDAEPEKPSLSPFQTKPTPYDQ